MPERKRRPPTPVESVRIANLRIILSRYGGHAKVADAVGWKSAGFVSHLLTGRNPFTERSARLIEQTFNLASGWMDTDNRGSLTGAETTVSIQDVLSAITEAVKDRGTELPMNKLSVLASIVEDSAKKNGGTIDKVQVKRLIELAS